MAREKVKGTGLASIQPTPHERSVHALVVTVLIRQIMQRGS